MDNPDPMAWPKRDDITRLNNYDHYDKLYFGEHYKAFAIKAERGFPEQYSMLRYVVANFAGLISKIMADMLFGEKIVIDCKDKNNQGFVDGLIEDNHLIAQLYESSLANSRRGDSVFKIRLGPGEEDSESKIIIEELTPAIYFPEMDVSSPRFTPDKDILAWVFTKGKTTYLHKEIHTAGQIENIVYEYNPDTKRIISRVLDDKLLADFGIEPIVETKVERSLVFHIPNFRDGNGFWGTSDYRDLEQLMFALNNRITKIDNILDKHSDPILAVPPGVLDEGGKVKKERLGMFEVDNENSGFNKPEYIVWNANLDSAFKEIDSLLEMLFMFSEIAPGSMGQDKSGGQAESGRALKFKMLRTIAKRNRKIIYYDIMIKEMLETAQEFGKAWGVEIDGFKITNVETPEIKWGDGILPDIIEMIDSEVARIDAAISSRADAISNLDGLKPEDAKAKVKEIDAESSVTVPSLDKTAPSGSVNPADGQPILPPVPKPAKFPTPPSNRI